MCRRGGGGAAYETRRRGQATARPRMRATAVSWQPAAHAAHSRPCRNRHDPPQSVRTRPRSQRGQLHAAHAAVADRAHRVHVSASGSRSSTAIAATRGRRPTRAAGGSRRRWSRAGIGVGDTVAVMAANTPEMVEAHFGVPMTGGVLNTLNTRLDADAIAFMLEHGEAKVLVTDTEFSPTIERALAAARDEAAASSTSSTRSAPAASASATSTTRRSSPAAIRSSRGSIRPTSGTRSRSTTRRARPAIRRASSTTIAARI